MREINWSTVVGVVIGTVLGNIIVGFCKAAWDDYRSSRDEDSEDDEAEEDGDGYIGIIEGVYWGSMTQEYKVKISFGYDGIEEELAVTYDKRPSWAKVGAEVKLTGVGSDANGFYCSSVLPRRS